MVKRKKKEETALTTPTALPEDASADMGYKTGTWAGRTQYRCKECKFDTLDLDTMLTHLLHVHSVIATQGPVQFPPSAGTNPSENQGKERADGVFEIDLKEDE